MSAADAGTVPRLRPHLARRAARGAARLVGRHRYITAFVLLSATATLWMFPVIANFDTALIEGPNDASSALRAYWAAEEQGETPFTLQHDLLLGAPDGVPALRATAIANPIQPGFMWATKGVLGLTGAWNAFVLIGLVASSFAMFVALDRLRVAFVPALFGGFVFGLSPWAFEKAAVGHAALTHTWVLPLLLLALLRVRRTQRLRDAAIAGLVVGLAFYVHSYVGLLALVLVGAFLVADLLLLRSWADRLWSLALFDAVWVVGALVVLPAYVAVMRDAASAHLSERPVEDLQLYGAAPLAYLVPSERHPVFGGLVARLWDESDSRHFAEPTLFFGYTTAVLAVAALIAAVRRRPLSAWHRFAVWLGAVLVPLAFFTSLPRLVDVFGLQIPAPSYFIGYVTTTWRVYARVGVLVGFGLILLATVALAWLVRRHRLGHVIAAAALVVVAFEFAQDPTAQPWRTDEVPPHVEWLARHPGGAVAHYPMLFDRPVEDAMESRELFLQIQHRHPLYWTYSLDQPLMGSVAARIFSKYLGEDPEAPGVLAAKGVRYAVIHHEVYRALGVEAPGPVEGLKRVASFPEVTIYRVTAPPMSIESLLANLGRRRQVAETVGIPPLTSRLGEAGFGAPEMREGLEWRWMRQGGAVVVHQPYEASRARYEVVARAFSNRRPRRLQVRTEEGRVLAQTTVKTFDAEARIGPFRLPRGTHELTLWAIPGPEPLGDGRSGSVYLGPFSVEPYVDFDRSLAAQ